MFYLKFHLVFFFKHYISYIFFLALIKFFLDLALLSDALIFLMSCLREAISSFNAWRFPVASISTVPLRLSSLWTLLASLVTSLSDVPSERIDVVLFTFGVASLESK